MNSTDLSKTSRVIPADELFAAFRKDVDNHLPNSRWAHTHGFGVRGEFLASPEARYFSSAEHFQGGPIPVTVRFSNSSSEAERHDEWQDIRGMATKFHLADGAETDLIGVSLNTFIAKTLQEFLGVAAANRPTRVSRERTWHKILDRLRLENPMPDPPVGQKVSANAGLLAYSGRVHDAQNAVVAAGMQAVPLSWARVKYHAIHTFVAIDSAGNRRHVRFSWQPVAGVCPVDDPTSQAPDFLSTEMTNRLRSGPVHFELKMRLADVGDEIDDPTVPWPVTRRMVMMGHLRIDRVVDDQTNDCERLSFNPMRLAPGMEASNDEILRARGEIYELASAARGAIGCPFHLAGAAADPEGREQPWPSESPQNTGEGTNR